MDARHSDTLRSLPVACQRLIEHHGRHGTSADTEMTVVRVFSPENAHHGTRLADELIRHGLEVLSYVNSQGQRQVHAYEPEPEPSLLDDLQEQAGNLLLDGYTSEEIADLLRHSNPDASPCDIALAVSGGAR